MSEAYEEKRNSTEAVTVWLLHLHFDAFFEIPERDFYFATTSGIDFVIDGEEVRFDALLTSVPSGRHQRDRGNDYAEFSLVNDGNSTYQDFIPYEDIIERGYLNIYQCLEIDRDYYEGEIRFVGYVKDFVINESEKTLKFTAISDMSRDGFPVAARILTRERCGTEFNYGGLNPPEFHACGWQVIMGGNPDFCSKYLKGVDSCVAHGNPHRFFAVEALAKATIEFVAPSDVDFPYDSQGCFTENVYVLLPDFSVRPINRIKEGDVILGFDMFNNNALVEATVLNVQKHLVKSISIVETRLGVKLETRREHLFCVKNNFFAPVGFLEKKQVRALNQRRKHIVDRVKRITDVAETCYVWNLHTTSATFIVTDENQQVAYLVHNNKGHTPIYL